MCVRELGADSRRSKAVTRIHLKCWTGIVERALDGEQLFQFHLFVWDFEI